MTPRRGGLTAIAFILLFTLLVLPGLALIRVARFIDPRLIVACALTIWAITFFLYQRDKNRAECGNQRIPESTLHFLELLGGWPAAFVAQRLFRHKIAKASYQITSGRSFSATSSSRSTSFNAGRFHENSPRSFCDECARRNDRSVASAVEQKSERAPRLQNQRAPSHCDCSARAVRLTLRSLWKKCSSSAPVAPV